MSEPTSVTIALNLDDHLARHLGYDADGEPLSDPMTVEDLVLDLAARKLVDQLLGGHRYGSDDPTKALRATLLERAESLASERVENHVEAAFEQLIHETSQDGREVLSHTLRKAIVKATETATKLRDGDKRRSVYSSERSVLERLITEEVERTVEREVKGVIDEAKNKARAEVARRASEAIADALAPKERGSF